MFISLGNEYFITDKNVTRDTFISTSAVAPNSWAEELMNRIYDCLFGNTTNIIEEYDRFYNVEYMTFGEYLQKKYGLDDDIIEQINSNLLKDEYLIRGFLDSEGDSNTSQLIEYNDDIVNAINEILASIQERNT